MSWLNLRLTPAKKAWQNFTSKLQSKLLLRKLNKSKAIKKPKYRTKSPSIKPATRRRIFHPSNYSLLPFKRRRTHFLSHKKTAPVYIDKLFREPVADELVAQRPPSAKTKKFLDKQVVTAADAGASCGEIGRGTERADDMWESLGFASPQLRGIDERAEQFINSFRAEMEVQEMMARGLCIENGSSS